MMDKSEDKAIGGLREDIENLLQAFLHKQTVRYQIFAEEWRNFNFSFIHYAIEKRLEKKETMFEAFRIATDYFLPPYELQFRVGALYILYALFETQPHKPKYKIRMCLEHWQSAKHLIETLEGQGHLDAVYIFNQLKMNKAFIFTAMPKRMIFHSSYMELKPEQNQTERWLDHHRHSLMTESFDDTTLEVNHDLHQQYQKKKVDLGLHDNTSLMVVKESITEYIVKRFAKLEASLEASQESTQMTESSDPDGIDHGSRVSRIKKQSYTTVAKASKSRRHRQQAAEAPPKETPSKSKFKKSKPKRGGLRKYTVTNTAIELAEDSSDDSSLSPSSSKKHKASAEVVKAPSVLQKRKPDYSISDDEEIASEQEAVQQDFYFFVPSTSQDHDLVARAVKITEAQQEGSMSVNSDDDTETNGTQGGTETLSSSNKKEQSLSPTPKKGTTKNSKSSEPAKVSNLRSGRLRKDSVSVSPTKTTTAVAEEESEKSKTVESKRGPPSRRQTRNSSLEVTATETKNDKKEKSKRGQPSQRQTRNSSPEITPTKTKDVITERSKRGRLRTETVAATLESNRSPEDTPSKKQKTSDKDNTRESESSKVLEGRDVAVRGRGRKTNVKVRGGKTGVKTRGSKRR